MTHTGCRLAVVMGLIFSLLLVPVPVMGAGRQAPAREAKTAAKPAPKPAPKPKAAPKPPPKPAPKPVARRPAPRPAPRTVARPMVRRAPAVATRRGQSYNTGSRYNNRRGYNNRRAYRNRPRYYNRSQTRTTTTYTDYTATLHDTGKVRSMSPPIAFDEKGNAKKYAPDELQALKGDDPAEKKLTGYKADFADLKAGDQINVSLARHQVDKGKDKDATKDKWVPAERYAGKIMKLSQPKDGSRTITFRVSKTVTQQVNTNNGNNNNGNNGNNNNGNNNGNNNNRGNKTTAVTVNPAQEQVTLVVIQPNGGNNNGNNGNLNKGVAQNSN